MAAVAQAEVKNQAVDITKESQAMNTSSPGLSSDLQTPLLISLQTLSFSPLLSYPPGPRVKLKVSFLKPLSAVYPRVASGRMLSAGEVWWTEFL